MVCLLGSGCAPASPHLTEKTGPVTKEARENAEIFTKLGRFIPDAAKAEDSFRTALAIARGQGARGYELRAVTSLARPWGEQSRRGEARELLAPVYGSFTEGFDTADLKDAKALLEELT